MSETEAGAQARREMKHSLEQFVKDCPSGEKPPQPSLEDSEILTPPLKVSNEEENRQPAPLTERTNRFQPRRRTFDLPLNEPSDQQREKEKPYLSTHRSKRRVEPTSPGFKPRQVVRKQADRARLHGYDCDCCAEYYKSLKGYDPKVFNEHTRHRAKHIPNDTPPDFWRLTFPDTQNVDRNA